MDLKLAAFGPIEACGWYFVTRYLTSKFSVSAACAFLLPEWHEVEGKYILSPSPSHVFLKTCHEKKGCRRAQTISGKSGRQNSWLLSTGAPRHVLYAQIKLRRTRNTTSDVITSLAEEYMQNTREMRERTGSPILKHVYWGDNIFFKKASKESDAAVEASYVVSEMIDKAGKPFKEGEFIKKCMLQGANFSGKEGSV